MPHLTCYRLRDEVAGHVLSAPRDYVDHERATEVHTLQTDGYQAELHVVGGYPVRPSWTGFLQPAFEPAVTFPPASSVSALLIMFLASGERFAFAFGPAGRHLLGEDVVERSWGRRVALNLMYPLVGGADSTDNRGRIRSADTKRVSHSVARLRRQFSRDEDLLAFDIDEERDLLRSITGRPHDMESWGGTITGGDAFSFATPISFEELSELCTAVEAEARKPDCDQLFPWIDHLRAVSDVSERDEVHAVLLGRLQTGDTDSLQLSPPEIVDWNRVVEFHFRGDGRGNNRVTRLNLELRDFLALERASDAETTVDRLKSRRVIALDGDGRDAGSWSVWRCLSGAVDVGQRTYVFDDGDVYEVARDFLAEIRASLERIPESSVALPSARHRVREADYNSACAAVSGGEILMLDRNLVSVPRSGSRIEVCDLLSRKKQLVHVKSEFHSATLSHLFNQGAVSARALMEADHRGLVADKLESVGGAQHRALLDDRFDPRDWEVTYAIIGSWRGRSLHDALPFFSRVTLRYAAKNLTQLGYKVTYKAIDREAPPRRKPVREVT